MSQTTDDAFGVPGTSHFSANAHNCLVSDIELGNQCNVESIKSWLRQPERVTIFMINSVEGPVSCWMSLRA